MRRFAETYAAGEPEDPRALLQEIGAAVERCLAVELCRVGVQDALGALRFAFVPNPEPHPTIQRAELEALRTRLALRGHPVRAP